MTEVNNSLAIKLLEAQKRLDGVSKDSKNPFFKSKYADLNAHLDVLKPVLNDLGLVLEQSTTIVNTSNGAINAVMTRVTDAESGLSKESVLQIGDYNGDMQKVGSAITYARRYTVSALFSMQAVDDDANFASGKVNEKVKSNNLF